MSIIDNHFRICEHSIFCFRIDAISLSRLNVLHSSLYQCYCFSSNNIEANLARHEDRSILYYLFFHYIFTNDDAFTVNHQFCKENLHYIFFARCRKHRAKCAFFLSSSTRSQKWEIKISKFLHETFTIYIYFFFPHCQMSYSNPRSTRQVFLLFFFGEITQTSRCWPLACLSVLSRGGAEEAAGRNKCGLTAARAGEGAEQEDGPGTEDERGGQVQVRYL